ncbi:MAG TPA: L,D-transpeptidase family protein [Methyloceanibacter sp.]|nr:L,D-transpeptidase family protein [Methyloceanibacter sp.]
MAAPLPLTAYAAEPESPDALIGQTDTVRAAIQERLSAKFTNATEARKSEQGALVEYYSVPENKLLWVDDHGLNDRAKAVMEDIGKADEYGLRPADYPLPKVSDESPDAKWLADAEIKISFAVLGYARDARGGRIDPQRISPNLDPDPILPDPMEVIESISFRSDPASYLRSFQPDQPQFEALRQALIEARGGNPDKDVVRIPDGPTLELGIDHEQVALLRKRLNIPVEDGGKETVFDASVHASVQRFQEDHGVLPDGVVGPGTRRLLNQQHHAAASPSKERLILLNMERWRWLPHDLGSFYVNVNIPEFVVRVMGDGKLVHSARVVVGKPDKQTPIISKEMQEIVFNPYWNVPNSIKTEEIRPFLVEEGGWFGGGGWNTAVLERHNLRINIGGREVDPSRIDWNRIDIRSLNIYQPPGPDNVLGNVKFVFPNKHDVYMHDTTQKSLFAKTVRAESHGCMRVQNPDQLAATLLKEDQGWSYGRVASAIQGGPDQHIALKEKIPVYITYFTLRVNEDGSISTFSDIYGHDARMAAALRL